MTIFLCGMMGSGKSTVGRRLSAATGLPFVDLDDEVAKAAGREIPDIFAIDGEAAFRDMEIDALRRAVAAGDSVIALGGGTLCREEARSLIARTGRMAYLRMGPEALGRRLSADVSRPLLPRDGKGAVSVEGIARLIGQREPWYVMAEAVVDVDGRSPDDIAGEIRCRLLGDVK
jgi:shikimate kinase